MDAAGATADAAERNSVEKTEDDQRNPSDFESLVTAEQVLSASVSRRRRNIARRRSSREKTPVRLSENDENEERPKMPERRRKKFAKDAQTLQEQHEDSSKESNEENHQNHRERMNAKPKKAKLSDEEPEEIDEGTVKERTESREGTIENNEEETKETDEQTNESNEIMKEITEQTIQSDGTTKESGEMTMESNEIAESNRKTRANNDEVTRTKKEPKTLPEETKQTREETKQIYTKQHEKDTDVDVKAEEFKKQKREITSGNVQEAIEAKIESIINISQTELAAMFDKAKQKIKSGRDRYRKKEALKRSQSAPRNLTDEELMESFKRAQLASAEREKQRKRSSSVRKYSTDSSSSELLSKEPPKPVPRIPKAPKKSKTIKTEQSLTAPRKKFDQRPACNKIVEILDPKTSKVIKTKEIVYIKFSFFQFLKVLKAFTIKDIVKEYRKFKIDMKHEHQKIITLRRKCISELLLMMVLCGLGGVLFKFVEGAFENFYKCGVKRIKRDFIDQLWAKSHNLREEDWKSLARNKLKIFEEELHVAHEAGVRTYTGKTSWSFLNGIVYSLSLVTTIGYGHMFPTTLTGKGLTILYALIGIPLFLIILTDFGKLFTRCIKFVWAFVRRLYYTGRCRRVRKTTHVEDIFKGAQMVYEVATLRRPSKAADPSVQVEEGTEDGGTSPATPAPSNYEIDDEFNLPITLALSILVMYIFLGAVAFQILEDWDFFSSFYFVFISLSTIGLGDFVPSNHIFMILSIVYLVFGLALMSMCINVVQDKLSDTFKRASAKIGATIGLTVNDEDGSISTVPPEHVEMPEVHSNKENAQKDSDKQDGNKNDVITTEIK